MSSEVALKCRASTRAAVLLLRALVLLGISFPGSTHHIPAGMALHLWGPSPPAVLLLLSLLGLAAAGKLLVTSVDGSPWFSIWEGLDMLRQKGHEVVVVVPEVSVNVKTSENFLVKKYPVSFTQEDMDNAVKTMFHIIFEDGSFLERYFKVVENMKIISDYIVSSCEQLLQNKELIRYLEESKFDAILTDPAIPCGVILAEHLSLPSVYFLRSIPCGFDSEATQCPNPPSYVPRMFSDLTDQMTFFQRVKNLLFDTQNLFLCDFAFEPYSKLASEFLQREVTVHDLFWKGSVWLLRVEFVLDYPRPLMPNMIPIGGVNCAHKELPQLLVVPVDGSHWLSMREVVDMLRQKGHEVVVVAPEVSLHIKPSKNFVMKMYLVPYKQDDLDNAFKASVLYPLTSKVCSAFAVLISRIQSHFV
ncbi:UDP-glucuronosyltransferase 1A1-like [Haemorhous mexicanus]|uniref:UDP-glucuronosyltransferase 1A1-like n=1 Tax=Haemorhous mexicanus TaxID=30427 RepID=UPI0028BEDA21|nr:UDP-glucuronosyltransferase 1A1-like [Haemorhous mexicanus]